MTLYIDIYIDIFYLKRSNAGWWPNVVLLDMGGFQYEKNIDNISNPIGYMRYV